MESSAIANKMAPMHNATMHTRVMWGARCVQSIRFSSGQLIGCTLAVKRGAVESMLSTKGLPAPRCAAEWQSRRAHVGGLCRAVCGRGTGQESRPGRRLQLRELVLALHRFDQD